VSLFPSLFVGGGGVELVVYKPHPQLNPIFNSITPTKPNQNSDAVSRLKFELSPEYRAMRRAGYEPVTGANGGAGGRMSAAQAMAMLGGRMNGGAYEESDDEGEEEGEGAGQEEVDDDEDELEEVTGAAAANGAMNGRRAGGKKAAAADDEWAAGKQAELDAALAQLAAAEANAAAVAKRAAAAGGSPRLQRDEVEEGDIARVISKWTGIPISKLVSTERCVWCLCVWGGCLFWWSRRSVVNCSSLISASLGLTV
jgi:hypothetical protein